MQQEMSSREKKHRRRKRNLAISLIIEAIKKLPEIRSKPRDDIRILEFGTGDAFQVSSLQTLGEVVASDIYISKNIRTGRTSDFVECDICTAPFNTNTFDIIFSNHVIEHIKDTKRAFEELRRIGKRECIFAFSVPTSLWILLSIPGYYCGIVAGLTKKIFRHDEGQGNEAKNERVKKTRRRLKDKIWRAVFPGGHGIHQGFLDCYLHLRIKAWKALFLSNNFEIVGTKPLLFYVPSELPWVPTVKFPVRYGLYSSILFILKQV
jgi:ubiquinone/menaquinone biosynthesis C-methylase UbiE